MLTKIFRKAEMRYLREVLDVDSVSEEILLKSDLIKVNKKGKDPLSENSYSSLKQ